MTSGKVVVLLAAVVVVIQARRAVGDGDWPIARILRVEVGKTAALIPMGA